MGADSRASTPDVLVISRNAKSVVITVRRDGTFWVAKKEPKTGDERCEKKP